MCTPPSTCLRSDHGMPGFVVGTSIKRHKPGCHCTICKHARTELLKVDLEVVYNSLSADELKGRIRRALRPSCASAPAPARRWRDADQRAARSAGVPPPPPQQPRPLRPSAGPRAAANNLGSVSYFHTLSRRGIAGIQGAILAQQQQQQQQQTPRAADSLGRTRAAGRKGGPDGSEGEGAAGARSGGQDAAGQQLQNTLRLLQGGRLTGSQVEYRDRRGQPVNKGSVTPEGFVSGSASRGGIPPSLRRTPSRPSCRSPATARPVAARRCPSTRLKSMRAGRATRECRRAAHVGCHQGPPHPATTATWSTRRRPAEAMFLPAHGQSFKQYAISQGVWEAPATAARGTGASKQQSAAAAAAAAFGGTSKEQQRRFREQHRQRMVFLAEGRLLSGERVRYMEDGAVLLEGSVVVDVGQDGGIKCDCCGKARDAARIPRTQPLPARKAPGGARCAATGCECCA